MDEELYLIVHKVRGSPALDVAQRILLSGGEELWLIPTSGHRAYPLRWRALAESVSADWFEAEEWAALSDHYSPRQRKGSMARLRTRLREIWKLRAKRYRNAYISARIVR